MTRREVVRHLFLRYLNIIRNTETSNGDTLAHHPRLSLANLDWMCQIGIEEYETLPSDKLSRWLGFIQGCLAMRELVDVDEERKISRSMFHTAYEKEGIAIPPTLER